MDPVIEDCLKKNEDEAIQTLKSLISINSVGGGPVTGKDGEAYPFGQGVQDAFAFMLKKAEECGFDVCDVDHYGGHIEWKGSLPAESSGAEDDSTEAKPAEETLGILAHLDTVPEGDGWEHGPFSGDIADDEIWGRGSYDDKGPLVASFYAMKSLKDAGYVPAKNVKLILGLDEETRWDGMTHYFERMPKPDFGFTPDADFPVLNGEKGIMSFKIAAKLKRTTVKGLELRKMSGGIAVNMVPAFARAVVNDQDPKMYDKIRDMAENYEMTTGRAIGIHKMGKSLEITAKGKAAHGSMPEQGVNAISVLIGFLGQLNFINEDLCNFFDFYNACIGMTTDGSKTGIAMCDEQSGSLSMNPGRLEYDGQAVSVICDIRYPVTHTAEEVYENLMPKVDEYGLGVLKIGNWDPLWHDPDSPLIRTFLDCYREETGDMESRPFVIGGGTYARTCDNFVAFGAMFPGDPQREHQPNERMPLRRFRQIMKIYTDAVLRLTQPDFHLEEGLKEELKEASEGEPADVSEVEPVEEQKEETTE